MNKKSFSDTVVQKRYLQKHFFRIMRTTAFLLFLFVFCLSAENTNSQNVNVTLKSNNMELEKVLNEIEQQTDFLFVYNNHVNVSRKVSVNLKKASLERTLENLFKGTNVKYSIDGTYILLSTNEPNTKSPSTLAVDQQLKRTISGIIKDEKGEPIVGANVVEKGTSNGTITDMNGKFNLSVEKRATLNVSYIGYLSQNIPVGEKKELNIQLIEDTQKLEEVVVVGYAVQKKANLSGSVATVDTKKLDDRPIINIGQALQGSVANLNVDPTSGDPNDLPSFNIRGFTSINGGSPLVVIDGVISDAVQLNHLNPVDVENISVLKDAASSAIYGSRAAYGVILVTTKTGKSEHVTINYNDNFSWRGLTSKPKDVMNSSIFYSDWNESNMSQFWSDEFLNAAKQYEADHSKPNGMYLANLDEWMYYDTHDRYSEIYKNDAFSMNHNINISGKTDLVNYYLSGGYNGQDGILKYGRNDYDQYNMRTKLEIQLTPWWKMGTNTDFISSEYKTNTYYLNNLSSNMQSTIGMCNVGPIKTDEGYFFDWATDIGCLEDGGNAKKHDMTIKELLTTRFDILKDVLFVNGQFNYSLQKVNTDEAVIPFIGSGGPGIYWTNQDVSSATANNGSVRHVTWDAYATFVKTFAQKHYFNAIFGFNQEAYRYNQQDMSKTHLISTNSPSVQLAYGASTVNENTTTWALRGLYGRLNYIYDSKYIFEFDFRRDGTSRFPHKDRVVLNPSASVGYLLSEEKFFAPLKKTINMFKIRGSYGRLGNQDVSAYAYIPTMSAYKSSYLLGGSQPMVVNAPGLVAGNLTWEKVNTADLGIDLALFGNKLTFTGDIYNRTTKGMLTAGQVLPAVLGADVPQENAADLKTLGYDLTLSWKDSKKVGGKPLQYGVDINFSDSYAEITKFENPTGTLNSHYKGERLGDIWGLHTLGLYATDEDAKKGPDQSQVLLLPSAYPASAGTLNWEDRNGDNKITKGSWTLNDHGDYSVIGNSSIRYRFGATLSASWNGVDFSAFFQGVLKHQYAPTPNDKFFWGKFRAPWYNEPYGTYYDRWTVENQNVNAYFPRLWLPNAQSTNCELGIPQTRYLQNAAYIRLKNLTLGYTLPQRWVSKLNIKRLRVYYSGENLCFLTGLYKYYKMDPENLDFAKYPLQRNNSIGVNITF